MQDAVDMMNEMLEANESLRDDESQQMFMAVFGGGGRSGDKYLPIELKRIQDAMRFPTDDQDGKETST